jgi:hypothetical protein
MLADVDGARARSATGLGTTALMAVLALIVPFTRAGLCSGTLSQNGHERLVPSRK